MAPKYFTSLDGLRGIAALLVVFSHYARDVKMFDKTAGVAGPEYVIGALGVMIFFALSGFLMMSVTDSLECNRVNVRKYFVNRFARVLPLFWFAIIFTSVYQIVLGDLFKVPQSSLAFSGFNNTFSAFTKHILLIRGDSVFWTISVEILFYILFPVLWFLTKSGEKHKTLYTIIFVVIAFQLATDFKYVKIPSFTRLNSTIQFFLLGTLVFSFLGKTDFSNNSSPLKKVLLTVLIFLSVAFLFPDVRAELLNDESAKSSAKDVWSTDFYFLGVVGLLLVAVLKYNLFKAFLRHKFVRYLGQISFSIYLTHRYIVTAAIPMGFANYSIYLQLLAFILVFVPIIILTSALTYKYIEKPAQSYIRSRFN